jgi:hypothetical protein
LSLGSSFFLLRWRRIGNCLGRTFPQCYKSLLIRKDLRKIDILTFLLNILLNLLKLIFRLDFIKFLHEIVYLTFQSLKLSFHFLILHYAF